MFALLARKWRHGSILCKQSIQLCGSCFLSSFLLARVSGWDGRHQGFWEYTFMISRRTLSCCHWWEFVYRQHRHQSVSNHGEALWRCHYHHYHSWQTVDGKFIVTNPLLSIILVYVIDCVRLAHCVRFYISNKQDIIRDRLSGWTVESNYRCSYKCP